MNVESCLIKHVESKTKSFNGSGLSLLMFMLNHSEVMLQELFLILLAHKSLKNKTCVICDDRSHDLREHEGNLFNDEITKHGACLPRLLALEPSDWGIRGAPTFTGKIRLIPGSEKIVPPPLGMILNQVG